MYTSWMNATVSIPINKLDGFERYSVKKGTSVSGSMTISSKQLQLNDAEKGWTVEPGLYKTTNVASQFFNGLRLLLCFCFVFFPQLNWIRWKVIIFSFLFFTKGLSLNPQKYLVLHMYIFLCLFWIFLWLPLISGTITIFVGSQQPNQHNPSGSNTINGTLLLYNGHGKSAGTRDCLTHQLIFSVVTFYICSYMAK